MIGPVREIGFKFVCPFGIFLGSWPVSTPRMEAVACWFAKLMEPETSRIARGLRRRDRALLDSLIEKYQPRLFRYLICLSGDRALAEDLSQEAWVRVLERGYQYDGKHEFSTWLFALARNLTIDSLRKERSLSIDALEPAYAGPTALEAAALHEQVERVSAALSSINVDYREAVTLRFFEELTLEEIAAITGAPLGTVKSRLYRGLNLLITQLKGQQP